MTTRNVSVSSAQGRHSAVPCLNETCSRIVLHEGGETASYAGIPLTPPVDGSPLQRSRWEADQTSVPPRS